jgi:hypothetical protein
MGGRWPGALVDPWDKLRGGAEHVLGALRAPLPGLEAPAAVAGLLAAARRLLASPRVRESDAGAAAARLVQRPTARPALGLRQV